MHRVRGQRALPSTLGRRGRPEGTVGSPEKDGILRETLVSLNKIEFLFYENMERTLPNISIEMTTSNAQHSVFIPSIHRTVNCATLNGIMGQFGEVVRVDFFEIQPQKKDWRRAAVYFTEASWPKVSELFLEAPEIRVPYEVGDKTYQATMTVNKNPVQFTEQNIHQLAHTVEQVYEVQQHHAGWFEYLIAQNLQKEQRITELERKLAKLMTDLGKDMDKDLDTTPNPVEPDLEDGEIYEEKPVQQLPPRPPTLQRQETGWYDTVTGEAAGGFVGDTVIANIV